jgi:hypothetical protein
LREVEGTETKIGADLPADVVHAQLNFGGRALYGIGGSLAGAPDNVGALSDTAVGKGLWKLLRVALAQSLTKRR